MIRRSSKLTAISKHPEYPELLAEIERSIERGRKRLVGDFLVMGKPVDQREIDYQRGWMDALHWVANVPSKAEDTLERALREAEKRKSGDT